MRTSSPVKKRRRFVYGCLVTKGRIFCTPQPQICRGATAKIGDGGMPVTIYTCGTPTKTRPNIRGPPSITDSVLIKVVSMPNPYHSIRNEHDDEERLNKVEEFLRSTCHEKFDKFVSMGEQAVLKNKTVIVQCLFGRDRSHAVARAIQRKCGNSVASIELIESCSPTAEVGHKRRRSSVE